MGEADSAALDSMHCPLCGDDIGSIRERIARMETMVQDMQSHNREICDILKRGEGGLVGRVQSLSERAARVDQYFKLVATGVVGLVIKAVWDLVGSAHLH